MCWIKTDDHEKITDKSPVSDSLKIHLLNHEVRLRKFHLIHSLHHRTFCKLFCVQPSPAQPSSAQHTVIICQPYLPSFRDSYSVHLLSQHRTRDWMFVRNVLWKLEISINQPDPSDQIKIFWGQNFTFSQSADV